MNVQEKLWNSDELSQQKQKVVSFNNARNHMILNEVNSLTSFEMLSLIIGNGDQKSREIAIRVLRSVNFNLISLSELSVRQLTRIQGIGESLAIRIAASIALGDRKAVEQAEIRTQISSSSDSYRFFKPLIGDLGHEEFWILLLNRHNKVIGKKQISKGGIAGTVADLKIIFKTALDYPASSIIAAHNHPSQNHRPSQADKNLTTKMVAAGNIIDIQVLDHLIITTDKFYSFADEGMI